MIMYVNFVYIYICPNGVFTFKSKRSSISDFVYGPSPVYVNIPATVKSPCIVVLPVVKFPSMDVS